MYGVKQRAEVPVLLLALRQLYYIFLNFEPRQYDVDKDLYMDLLRRHG